MDKRQQFNCNEFGKYKYIGSGETTIDYGLVDREMWDEVEEFKIGMRIESDHMPLEVRFKLEERNVSEKNNDDRRVQEKTDWSEEGIELYRKNMEKLYVNGGALKMSSGRSLQRL